MGRVIWCLCCVIARHQVSSQAPDDDTCPAEGCAVLPVYPDCNYSCNERPFIGADSGNKEQIWPECPDGKDGCRKCEDKHPACPEFADAYDGYGCEDNPSFMIDVCAKSCNTCHLRDLDARCKQLQDVPEAIKPGDMNATFERILRMPQLQTEVLSRDPWVLKFPNFLDDEEVTFFRNVQDMGLKWTDASDTGEMDDDGRAKRIYSSHRSTGVCWCNHACHSSKIAGRVRARISEIVRVHPHYFESFQFLQYKKGQYYKPHHDSGIEDSGPSKHRVYTFFLYLNDVEEGGETEFPVLKMKVKPRRGTAILWPSVFNHDPWKIDGRTTHGALPVEKGSKYSINIWVHLGPFVLAHDIACSGSPIE